MRPGAFGDHDDRFGLRDRRPVGTGRRHRIVEVGDAEQAADQRDLIFAQPFRIPRAIPSFMVIQHSREDRRDRRTWNGDEDLRAVQRMLLHLREFVGGQPPGLVENGAGNGELADVVQQRGEVRDLLLGGAQADLDRDAARERGDALRVSVTVAILGVNRGGDGIREAVEVTRGSEHFGNPVRHR